MPCLVKTRCYNYYACDMSHRAAHIRIPIYLEWPTYIFLREHQKVINQLFFFYHALPHKNAKRFSSLCTKQIVEIMHNRKK